jgi:hypothetical protein
MGSCLHSINNERIKPAKAAHMYFGQRRPTQKRGRLLEAGGGEAGDADVFEPSRELVEYTDSGLRLPTGSFNENLMFRHAPTPLTSCSTTSRTSWRTSS